jgi:hypothetical protein
MTMMLHLVFFVSPSILMLVRTKKDVKNSHATSYISFPPDCYFLISILTILKKANNLATGT